MMADVITNSRKGMVWCHLLIGIIFKYYSHFGRVVQIINEIDAYMST